jgi:DNA-binding NarL/FixJ family response regulator
VKVLLVVEDDPEIRLLLRFEFDRDPDLQIQGKAAEAESAIALARSIQPALVILDHRLAGEVTGLEAAPRLKALVPGARMVLFSASARSGPQQPLARGRSVDRDPTGG